MPNDTPATWQALYDAIGGRAALAQLCQVSESTVYRWSRADVTPAHATITFVHSLCDSHGVAHVFTPADAPPAEKEASNA